MQCGEGKTSWGGGGGGGGCLNNNYNNVLFMVPGIVRGWRPMDALILSHMHTPPPPLHTHIYTHMTLHITHTHTRTHAYTHTHRHTHTTNICITGYPRIAMSVCLSVSPGFVWKPSELLSLLLPNLFLLCLMLCHSL